MARKKKEYSPEAYYTVKGWMINDLGLKGNKLLVYAFIYGYSSNQSGKGCYFAGNEGIKAYTGCATSSIPRVIQELLDEHLIEVKTATLDNGLPRNYYRVDTDRLDELSGLMGYESLVSELNIIHTFDELWKHPEELSKRITKVEERRKGRIPKTF